MKGTAMKAQAPRCPSARLRLLALVVGMALGTATAAAAQDDAPMLISLDADSVSVNTVLQSLASRSGLNIVTGPEVQGQKISLHLKNTPFDEALDLTVRAAGFGYQRVGRSILVGDAGRLERETGFSSYVATLQYADAQETKKLLEVLTKNVEVDLLGNRLVATGTPSIIEQIKDVISKIDVPPPSVLIESRVIEITTSSLQELGIQWDKIAKFSTVLSEGDPGIGPTDEVPENLPFYPTGEYNDLYRQAEAIEVAVDLLITDGNAKILADAKVLAMSNRKAEIFIGDDIPVVITSLGSGQGIGTVQQIQLEHIKVGIELAVTPRIAENDYVMLVVQPKVSSIIEFIGPDSDLPRTSERKATTSVRALNGRTLFIGGLQSEETKKTVQKVPLLGDIPYLGYLFQHHRNEAQKKDLLIEITPTIVQ